MPPHPPLVVDHADVVALQRRLGDPATSANHVRRALIVLLSSRGLDAPTIAGELGCGEQTVAVWQERFRTAGLTGLADAPRSGRPPSVDAAAVVALTLRTPPLGSTRWTSRLIAAELGVSNVSVAGAWRAWGIRPTREGGVSLTTQPALPGAFSAVVGLCVRPGTGVLALERAARPAGGRPSVPVADRPDLRDRVPDVGRRAEPDADADVAAFLRAVADRHARRPFRASPALLVTGLSTPLAQMAVGLGLGLFVARPDTSWARLLHVACLLAAAEEHGRTTVLALDAALRGSRPTSVFTWRP